MTIVEGKQISSSLFWTRIYTFLFPNDYKCFALYIPLLLLATYICTSPADTSRG
jgi:hypothetical protein